MKRRKRSRVTSTLAGLVLGVTTISACSSSDESTQQPTTVVTDTEAVETTATAESRTLLASYQGATVYAGATDYYFEDADNQIVEFRVSNLPDEQTVELPDNMLDPKVVEGPPGANPALVGESFLLIYDDDQLVRVELSE